MEDKFMRRGEYAAEKGIYSYYLFHSNVLQLQGGRTTYINSSTVLAWHAPRVQIRRIVK